MGTISDFDIEETKERIDVDKLRVKEKILFYQDLTLYEDELHDHGIAALSVKIVSHHKAQKDTNNFSYSNSNNFSLLSESCRLVCFYFCVIFFELITL